jgi:hypothetical protein
MASDCRIQSWSISVSDFAARGKDIWVHKAKKDKIVRKAQVPARSMRNVLLSKQGKGAVHNLRSTFEAVHGSERASSLLLCDSIVSGRYPLELLRFWSSL